MKVENISFDELDFDSLEWLDEKINFLENGNLLIVKNALPKTEVSKIKEYLSCVGKSSFPNYFPIEVGCPNFHRLNDNDERSYVRGCFHQFVFFPWNQDVFSFFGTFKKLFQFKNLLSKQNKDEFLGSVPSNDCIARISFQFYPSGGGYLNKHKDPVDYHQLVLPLLIMSKRGDDFNEGGLYVEFEQEKIYLDDLAEPGDVLYFRADCNHGVEKIDPILEKDWLSFKGRWMGLLAVNKLSTNTRIENAKELE